MRQKRNERKNIIREVSRKTMHIVIGLTITLLAYTGYIEAYHILLLAVLLSFFSIVQMKYPIRAIDSFLYKVDRTDIIPAFGAITLMLGIGLSFLIFPIDIALIAGVCVSMIDGISTIIASFQEKRTSKRNALATLAGMIAAFAVLTSFFTHIPLAVIMVGVIVGGIVDATYNRIWHLDDNVVMPLTVGLACYVALIIIRNAF